MALQRPLTELDAANGALGLLGEPAIADFNEKRKAARACKQRFGAVRDRLLRAREDNFSVARVTPGLTEAVANAKFTKRYNLPEDCLKVRGVDGLAEDEWSVETRDDAAAVPSLLTNIDAPKITYTRRVETVRLWDAMFCEAFEAALAAEIQPRITGDLDTDRLDGKAERRGRKAARIDGRESGRAQISRDTSWVRVRQ